LPTRPTSGLNTLGLIESPLVDIGQKRFRIAGERFGGRLMTSSYSAGCTAGRSAACQLGESRFFQSLSDAAAT
jgi:hypothetical protein